MEAIAKARGRHEQVIAAEVGMDILEAGENYKVRLDRSRPGLYYPVHSRRESSEVR